MRAALIAILLAAGANLTATQALQKRDAEIRAVLPPAGQQATEAQTEKAEDLLTRTVDFKGMAEASLGKHWKTMTEAQRKELLDAFTRRFKQASGSQVDFYRSTEIKYAPETQEGELVKVPTSMVVKGEPTNVTYVMKQTSGGWQIEDIVIDDVSTIENYRSSFAKVINKEGVDGLIAKLNKGSEKAGAAKGEKSEDAGGKKSKKSAKARAD